VQRFARLLHNEAARAQVLQYAVTMRVYRVGVIGHTGRGNYGHRLDLVWKLVGSTKVAAVADADPAGLQEAARRLGTPAAYADYREMLRQEAPDLVAIATRWPDQHVEMALAAVEAKAMGIYMDKPIARTPAEADRILSACDAKGVKLAVAHQMRISPLIDVAKQKLAEGAIGKLLEMRGRGKEDGRAGGEDLMVLGTHVFDLMRQLAGDPVWASARITAGANEMERRDVHEGREGLGLVAGDNVAAMYSFRYGTAGYFASRRSDDESGKRWGLDLYGSRGVIAIRADMANPVVYLMQTNEGAGAPWTRLTLPDTPPRTPDEANRELVEDLIAAIEENRQPKANGRDALWAVEMAMAAYESQMTGGRVYFPMKKRTHPLAS